MTDPDQSFNAIQLAQLKLLFRETIQEEFANVGIRVDDETQVFETRKDFAMLRWFREASGRTAQKVGWAVIAAFVAGVLAIMKLGFDAYVHKGP